MKRNRKRRVTAMAMAVMMAAASFNVSGIAMPVYAAEQSDEIHFPDVYEKTWYSRSKIRRPSIRK